MGIEWIDTKWCNGYGSKRECDRIIEKNKEKNKFFKILEIMDRGFCILIYEKGGN